MTNIKIKASAENTDSFNEKNNSLRKIRSFVRREGRLTKGQKKALNEYWDLMGVDFATTQLNWQDLFGNDNPVVVEIGFGMGASLVSMAKNAPDHNFLGIEVHRPGVGACLAAAHDAQIKNLKVMCHDAVEVFTHMLPNNSIATMQLFFPDPWHKKRHHKRRIVRADFANMIKEKLIAEHGIFHIATDWENYAEHIVKVMMQNTNFVNLASNGNFVERPSTRPLTKFEARAHRLGHGVWDIQFKRIK